MAREAFVTRRSGDWRGQTPEAQNCAMLARWVTIDDAGLPLLPAFGWSGPGYSPGIFSHPPNCCEKERERRSKRILDFCPVHRYSIVCSTYYRPLMPCAAGPVGMPTQPASTSPEFAHLWLFLLAGSPAHWLSGDAKDPILRTPGKSDPRPASRSSFGVPVRLPFPCCQHSGLTVSCALVLLQHFNCPLGENPNHTARNANKPSLFAKGQAMVISCRLSGTRTSCQPGRRSPRTSLRPSGRALALFREELNKPAEPDRWPVAVPAGRACRTSSVEAQCKGLVMGLHTRPRHG